MSVYILKECVKDSFTGINEQINSVFKYKKHALIMAKGFWPECWLSREQGGAITDIFSGPRNDPTWLGCIEKHEVI